MRSSVAWKSQPPTAPLIVGPGAAIGTQVNDDSFSTGLIQAAPTPTGSFGRRSKLVRSSPHLWPAKPSGGTYLTFLGLSAASPGTAAQRQGRQEIRDRD